MNTETGHPSTVRGAEVLRAKITEAYARQSRQATEERLILEYIPLVRHIVQRVTVRMGMVRDVDDLISAGTLGLVRAAKGFDPTRNVEFKTYAYIRIRGAVLDELRGRSFVPSSIHAKIRTIQQAYRRCQAAAGGPPGDAELANEAGMPLEELYRTLQEARKQHFLSIHGFSDTPSALAPLAPRDPEPTPAVQVERKELLEKLAEAITKLPKRDRVMILLYYDRDLTMKEVAAVLGVTESRVSQMHASAVFKLAMKMKGKP